jgi:hypothetical protein
MTSHHSFIPAKNSTGRRLSGPERSQLRKRLADFCGAPRRPRAPRLCNAGNGRRHRSSADERNPAVGARHYGFYELGAQRGSHLCRLLYRQRRRPCLALGADQATAGAGFRPASLRVGGNPARNTEPRAHLSAIFHLPLHSQIALTASPLLLRDAPGLREALLPRKRPPGPALPCHQLTTYNV